MHFKCVFNPSPRAGAAPWRARPKVLMMKLKAKCCGDVSRARELKRERAEGEGVGVGHGEPPIRTIWGKSSGAGGGGCEGALNQCAR